jgi:hypothetical protein
MNKKDPFSELKYNLDKLEISTNKDIDYIKVEIDEIKSDIKRVDKNVLDIKRILNQKEGFISGLRSAGPFVGMLIAAIISLLVYVGFEQRLEQESKFRLDIKTNSEKIEKIIRRLDKNEEP